MNSQDSLSLDNFCAKKRGLSYGEFVALTDEKEREKLRKAFLDEWKKAKERTRKK